MGCAALDVESGSSGRIPFAGFRLIVWMWNLE